MVPYVFGGTCRLSLDISGSSELSPDRIGPQEGLFARCAFSLLFPLILVMGKRFCRLRRIFDTLCMMSS